MSVDTLIQDLRYALRSLRRSPGFTLVAALTLALGIGANGAVFSTVDAMLLRPLPVAHPEQLAALWRADPREGRLDDLSWPDFVDYRDQSGVFAGMAGHFGSPVSLSTRGRPEMVWSEVVTENYFSLLGLAPAAGRFFTAADDRGRGSDPLVVLAYNYWHRRFAGDPRVVGSAVSINGHPFTIVGVAPAGFRGLRLVGYHPDVWVPLEMHRAVVPGSAGLLDGRGHGHGFLLAFGRMKPGRGPASTAAAASAFAADLERAHPVADRDLGARIVSARTPSDDPDYTRPQALAFGSALAMAAVALVLLVACTNLVNLLLVRAAARQREIAVRHAMGATRGRLVRQLLAESAVLAGLGAAGALGLVVWNTDLQGYVVPRMAFRVGFDPGLDWRVLLFTFGAAAAAVMVFGLTPALRASRPDVVAALKATGRQAGSRGGARRDLLVVLQVAISLVLLVAGGLFLRGLWRARQVDLGIAPSHRLILSVNPGLQGYDRARGETFYREATQRIGALPGVESVSMARPLPLDGSGNSLSISVPGLGGPDEGRTYDIGTSAVGPDYFATVGTQILEGRGFTEADSAGAPDVIVVNRTMAARFWPGQDPLGKVVHLDSAAGPPAVVVGLARDGKYVTVWEGPRSFAFRPLRQAYRSGVTLVVHTRDDPASFAPRVEAEIHALDPNLPVFGVMTGAQFVASALNVPIVAAVLAGLFGALALLLAVVGIYGVVSYTVTQRNREVGIRVALGADRADVLRLVIGRTGRLALAGMGAGLVLALGVGRIVAHLLYGVSGADPLTFAVVPLLLALVVLAACWIPARRAARIDPVEALRSE